MKFTTVQWNIGGARIANENSDRSDDLSYSDNGLKYVIDNLKKYSPDIITLQEVHDSIEGGLYNQAKLIADDLGFKNLVIDHYNKSHLENDMWLSQTIISKYSILEHDFSFFPNPNVDVMFANKIGKSHDKGVSSALIDVAGNQVRVKTLHMIPFRRTGMLPNDPIFSKQNEDLNTKIVTNDEHFIMQADFNYDNESLSDFIPAIKLGLVNELLQNEPTTPEGQRFDHVIYRGLCVVSSKVDASVMTDHLPIITEFEV